MSKKILLLLLATGLINFTSTMQAKNIEYSDSSCQTANTNLINFVDGVAQELGYTSDYELVEPTRAGVLANPFNRMMYAVVNPLDQNDLILINQDWLNGLDLDAQKFLIAVNLVKLDLNKQTTMVKVWPYMIMIISFLILLIAIWFINKTSLKKHNIVIRFLLVLAGCIVFEFVILDRISNQVAKYLEFRQINNINQQVIAKLNNKPAAIRALEYVNQSIKAGIKDGHNLYKQHEFRYENLIKKIN